MIGSLEHWVKSNKNGTTKKNDEGVFILFFKPIVREENDGDSSVIFSTPERFDRIEYCWR